MKQKCIVLFSGGLDSRLAIKIMQDKNYDVLSVFFKLPFVKQTCRADKIFDCSKGKLLQEYLDVIKKAKHGTGAGVNPCIDCRIFMFKKARKFADKNKIKWVVTGEVMGQRPMSQQQKQINLIEKETELKNRIIRPLIDYYGFKGRNRKPQIALAKKFKIKYPSPAGGCLLCEKELKNRLKYLLKREMNEKEIKLVNVGRHFLIDKCWVVLGRNQAENKIIEALKVGELIEPDYIGPSAIVLDKGKKKTIEKINELIKAYSKQGSLKDRKKFEKEKL